MARRDGLRNDPEFAAGWTIAAVIAAVLAVILGLTVWATGSWLLGMIVAVLAGVGLALCF